MSINHYSMLEALRIPEILAGYACPVCGFGMVAPPEKFNICPSCGTEFGNDDLDWSYDQLRLEWLENGANWWSESIPAPVSWDPIEQVLPLIEVGGSENLEDNTFNFEDEFFQISPGIWTFWRTAGIAETVEEELCPD